MAQIQEAKNLFEFDKSDLDICELDKTACFFCPSENGGENSFSTQMTDETKETSIPATPEQDDQPKPKVKTFTLKRKVLSDQKHPVNSILEQTAQDRLVSDLRENLTQVLRSDAKPKFNQVKSLPVLTPITVSHRGRTAPLPVGKELLTDSLEIKDFLVTETGLESENQNLYMDFQSTTAKAAFYKGRDHREGSSDWKLVHKDNFIIKKSAKSRMQVRNLNAVKAQNSVISDQAQLKQTAVPQNNLLDKEAMDLLKFGKTKTRSLQINTEGDLESTSYAACEYNMLKNARPFDFIKIANYTPNPQTVKYPPAVNHKKVATVLTGDQDGRPIMRNIVTPKVLSTSSSGAVKFNIIKRKEINQSQSEQNLEPKPCSSIFSSDTSAVQKTEGSSRQAFYAPRVQPERPKSRFKNQEVVLSRLFNMKIQ